MYKTVNKACSCKGGRDIKCPSHGDKTQEHLKLFDKMFKDYQPRNPLVNCNPNCKEEKEDD